MLNAGTNAGPFCRKKMPGRKRAFFVFKKVIIIFSITLFRIDDLVKSRLSRGSGSPDRMVLFESRSEQDWIPVSTGMTKENIVGLFTKPSELGQSTNKV